MQVQIFCVVLVFCVEVLASSIFLFAAPTDTEVGHQFESSTIAVHSKIQDTELFFSHAVCESSGE